MKQRQLLGLVLVFALPLMLACGGGGGGDGVDDSLNIYGFRFDKITPTTTVSLTNADVRALAPNKTKTLVYTGTANGLFTFNPAAGTNVFTQVVDASLTNNPINAILFETDGDLLVGTDNGLYRQALASGAFAAVNGYAGKKVLCLTEEAAGTVWVGMEDLTASTSAIAKLDTTALTSQFWGSTGTQGMLASSVVEIYADASLIIACTRGDTTRDGLYKFDGQVFARFNSPKLASGATLFRKVGAATYYSSGHGAGLIRSNDSGVTWESTTLTDVIVYDMAVHPAPGDLTRYWLATDKGLYLTYNFTEFHRYHSGSGMLLDNTTSLANVDQLIWSAHPGATGGITRAVFTGN